ncbi:MAG: hypothetical protein EBW84_11650 [Betaproteobacteria bacterium]|nr:hypothetical protein [Betaproteobacteria bacterium]
MDKEFAVNSDGLHEAVELMGLDFSDSEGPALDAATRPEDMNRPGWDWHALKGGLSGQWSVSVNGNWRLTFGFVNGDAILVDYQDYH